MDLIKKLKEIEEEIKYNGSPYELKIIKQAINRLNYKEKQPIGIDIISVNKISYEVKDNSLLPHRIVDEYSTLDGIFIGTVDRLDYFLLINDSAVDTLYSPVK